MRALKTVNVLLQAFATAHLISEVLIVLNQCAKFAKTVFAQSQMSAPVHEDGLDLLVMFLSAHLPVTVFLALLMETVLLQELASAASTSADPLARPLFVQEDVLVMVFARSHTTAIAMLVGLVNFVIHHIAYPTVLTMDVVLHQAIVNVFLVTLELTALNEDVSMTALDMDSAQIRSHAIAMKDGLVQVVSLPCVCSIAQAMVFAQFQDRASATLVGLAFTVKSLFHLSCKGHQSPWPSSPQMPIPPSLSLISSTMLFTLEHGPILV